MDYRYKDCSWKHLLCRGEKKNIRSKSHNSKVHVLEYIKSTIKPSPSRSSAGKNLGIKPSPAARTLYCLSFFSSDKCSGLGIYCIHKTQLSIILSKDNFFLKPKKGSLSQQAIDGKKLLQLLRASRMQWRPCHSQCDWEKQFAIVLQPTSAMSTCGEIFNDFFFLVYIKVFLTVQDCMCIGAASTLIKNVRLWPMNRMMTGAPQWTMA